MAEKKILIFHPDIYIHKTDNVYTKNIYALLEKHYRVRSLEWFIKHPYAPDIECIYLNWYENTIGNKKVVIQRVQYLLKKIVLLAAYKRRIRIVYMVHNKTPHNISKESKIYQKVTRNFMNYALNLADIIGILCEHTEEYLSGEFRIHDLKNKIRMIPLGKYKKYKCDLTSYRKKYGINDDELIFSFVGKMDKYKNIDIMIKAFYHADINGKLLLIGRCTDTYKEIIEHLIQDERVICNFSFVSDENMSAIFQISDAIILPYDNTSINSSMMINAFSNGTTVIGTDIEMLQSYSNELVYGYTYTNDKEHIQKLAEAMLAAQNNRLLLKEKGQKLQSIVENNNSWKIVEEKLIMAVKNGKY